MINSTCPKCGNIITIDDNQIGEAIECPKCANINFITAPGSGQQGTTYSQPPLPTSFSSLENDNTMGMLCHLLALSGYRRTFWKYSRAISDMAHKERRVERC